jgi:hypothetical protein
MYCRQSYLHCPSAQKSAAVGSKLWAAVGNILSWVIQALAINETAILLAHSTSSRGSTVEQDLEQQQQQSTAAERDREGDTAAAEQQQRAGTQQREI